MADNGRQNPVDRHVGLQVARYRQIAGLSARELADLISARREDLEHYEKGTHRLGPRLLCTIAQALDVPLSVFFQGLGSEVQPRPPLAVSAPAEGLELLRAFTSIEDETTRAHLVELVRRVADYCATDSVPDRIRPGAG